MFRQWGVAVSVERIVWSKGFCRILWAFLDQRFHGVFGPPMMVVKRIERCWGSASAACYVLRLLTHIFHGAFTLRMVGGGQDFVVV